MLVLLERPSPRARYIVGHVLERMLGLEVEYVDEHAFAHARGPRLSYGTIPYDGAIHVPWSGALEALPTSDPVVYASEGAPRMFLVNDEQDVFAGIFFLLSLTDEIACLERDQHGRVPSNALFVVRKGIADRPWVDERVMELGIRLENTWPNEVQCAVRYQNHVTVDMDNILRYAGRPLSRAIGASVKDLLRGEWSAIGERWKVRNGAQHDPYANAVNLVAANRHKVSRAIFFFLMRGGTSFDHAADQGHSAVQEVIDRASTIGEVGVHPSYHAREDIALAEEERSALMRLTGRSVVNTRYHFLRWDVPDSLRRLSRLPEHHQEHTLGFSDRAGFRAGTCTPFPWYDLDEEKETGVMLHPFTAMDSALIEKQGMGPDEVVSTMNAMSDLVRAVNGKFISVWHDRYLSGHREFAPWPAVYERVMGHAAS